MSPIEALAVWFAETPSGPGVPDMWNRESALAVVAALEAAGYQIVPKVHDANGVDRF